MPTQSNNPELWSDFDGTSVAIVGKHNPRNWLKYPLPMIEGYTDFLRGVQQSGVEIAGIVSRRPAVRKWVTARSIAKHGLDEFFPGKHQVVLAGSETKKAQHLVDRSKDRVVGIIDDKPHKIAREIIALAAPAGLDQTEPAVRQKIVLGATNHDHTTTYLNNLVAHAIDRRDDIYSIDIGARYLQIWNSVLDLRVVPVDPYSVESGQAFAAALTQQSPLEFNP